MCIVPVQVAWHLLQDIDNASLFAAFTPELRAEVFLTMPEEELRYLSPEFVEEAQIVRKRTAEQEPAHICAYELGVFLTDCL